MGASHSGQKGGRSRGRPSNKKPDISLVSPQPEPIVQPAASMPPTETLQTEPEEKQIAQPQPSYALPGDSLAVVPEEEEFSPFSSYLRQILRQDNIEVAFLAQELGVAENTLYRWLNGNSVPRATHLKKLLALFPQHYTNLAYAIEQTFPGTTEALTPGIREVQKNIYRSVLELLSSLDDAESCTWHITQTVFEAALLHLDPERAGLAITFAKALPAHDGTIHTLYEAEMRGTYPWPATVESKAYLGSTTLAGTAAMLRRTRTWDDLADSARLQYTIDEFEHSACAHPVMRMGRVAGVLVVSSTQTGFFSNLTAQGAVIEYAQLLALGLKEDEFYSPSQIQLRPMPNLQWQRAKLGEVFKNRVVASARKHHLSRPEAEDFVREEMAAELEEITRVELERQQQFRADNYPLQQTE